MFDLPPPVILAVVAVATLLPLVALVGARWAWSSNGPRRGLATTLWSLVAMALAYLHPLVQEGVNQAHLEPKLERARALHGETVERLYAELGVPTQVVAASHGRAGSYGYATFGPAWWAPLAQSEVVVPLSEDGMRVSMIAHLAD